MITSGFKPATAGADIAVPTITKNAVWGGLSELCHKYVTNMNKRLAL
jgi:hypothetical protein